MEVDKSRAALTSGETPLPLCGGEAELTSRFALGPKPPKGEAASRRFALEQ